MALDMTPEQKAVGQGNFHRVVGKLAEGARPGGPGVTMMVAFGRLFTPPTVMNKGAVPTLPPATRSHVIMPEPSLSGIAARAGRGALKVQSPLGVDRSRLPSFVRP